MQHLDWQRLMCDEDVLLAPASDGGKMKTAKRAREARQERSSRALCSDDESLQSSIKSAGLHASAANGFGQSQ